MATEAPTPVPGRPSAFEREKVARKLRDSCAEERVSLDTFSERIDRAYRARSRAQLDEVLVDLNEPRRLARFFTSTVARVSQWTAHLEAAWREPRTPRLALPFERHRVTLGRSPDCDCVLGDPTVSRKHARLSYRDGKWWLADLASTNGTRLNGWRVVEEVEVRPGDRVSFGGARYRLTAPS